MAGRLWSPKRQLVTDLSRAHPSRRSCNVHNAACPLCHTAPTCNCIARIFQHAHPEMELNYFDTSGGQMQQISKMYLSDRRAVLLHCLPLCHTSTALSSSRLYSCSPGMPHFASINTDKRIVVELQSSLPHPKSFLVAQAVHRLSRVFAVGALALGCHVRKAVSINVAISSLIKHEIIEHLGAGDAWACTRWPALKPLS